MTSITYTATVVSILGQEAADGFLQLLTNANLPAVMSLAMAGTVGVFFIIRQVRSVQKEIIVTYIAENTRLRGQNDLLELEVVDKDRKLSEQIRAQLILERQHHDEITHLKDQINDLRRRLGE